MIRISATNEDYQFFSELNAKYGGIDIITGKGLDGSTDLLDVIIQLSPTVLPFVAYIIHEIVGYMKEKKVQDTKKHTQNPSRITIEKRDKNGEFKIILESDQIDDINSATNKAVKLINKLDD